MNNYPKISELNIEQVTEELIWDIIEKSKKNGKLLIITPLSIFKLTGFNISDQSAVLEQKTKINKIKRILKKLEIDGSLRIRNQKQDYKGIKEIS